MRCALGDGTPGELLERALTQHHLDYERMVAEPHLATPPLAILAGTTAPYTVGSGPRVVVVDFGCKRSIIRRLVEAGLEVVVVPPTIDAASVLSLDPRAVLVGNGPGDPAQLTDAVETVRELLGRVRLFGSASAISF